MEEYFPLPERRYPSPAAQRRSGEHWKARFGLVTVVVLTLLSAGMMFRLAGVGVGLAISPLRGQTAGAPARPAGAATAPAAAGQQPGQAPATQPTAAPAAQPAAPATQPTAPAAQPSPTTRPGQREYTVASGDTLSSIASRNNTSVDAIVAANNLRSRDVTLSIGQKLVIP